MRNLLAKIPWSREARRHRRIVAWVRRAPAAFIDQQGRTRYSWGPGTGMDFSDKIPAILSPGRSTTIRPGETDLEAMDRLMRGEDL